MRVNLDKFKNGTVLEGALSLFGSLGVKFNTLSERPVDLLGMLPQPSKAVTAAFDKVDCSYFLGSIDDATLRGADEALSLNDEIHRIDQHYKGMMAFALEAKPGTSLTRTEIATLTRALNRISKAAPVALVIRYGDRIAFSLCERTPYVQSGHTGEKPGVVNILRDIKYNDPHRGHLDILSELQVSGPTTFEELYKKWFEVFNNDILTNKFYRELQNWFFWAIKNVSFPNDIEDYTDDEKYNPENVIRLITRLVFVWFLRQKGLIPKEIFDIQKLKNILKNFNPESRTSFQYYHAILQNLFFATLNRKIEDRDFAFDNGFACNRSNHDIRNLYRYEKQFVWFDEKNKDNSQLVVKDQVLKLFHKVPYMNNSLFECLDNKTYKGKKYYWDGFCRNPKLQAHVPNFLFFTEKEYVDLSKEYDNTSAAYRSVEVHGLLNILSKYNFTIEENTPLDIDVALDPELLGKVFENLLAAYNPETKKTVRKSTGSYYTPRPIVQYMVDESIIAYLRKSVPSVTEEVLRQLLSYEDESHNEKLSFEDRQALVTAIFNGKFLDPACGSGAFPMGMLQQLSHLLAKIDSDNKLWGQIVIERAVNDESHLENNENRDVLKAEIEKVFNLSVDYPDYARKLYLIENCIYGVDIQCIAVQISRLRFFISLVCEQKPSDDPADNYGIRPLPNLEMKFVCANTLVKLEHLRETRALFDNKEIENLIEELKAVRHNLFVVSNYQAKQRLLKKDAGLREQIMLKTGETFQGDVKTKIATQKSLREIAQEELKQAEEMPDQMVDVVVSQTLFGDKIETRRENLRDKKINEAKSRIRMCDSEIKRLNNTLDPGRDKVMRLAKQLTDWNPYDQNVSSPFFDPEWMFGITDGFDIVIGNPPYVSSKEIPFEEKEYYNSNYNTAKGQYDKYGLFIEKGYTLLSTIGIFSLIVPDSLIGRSNFQPVRDVLLKNTQIISWLQVNNVFESANVSSLIFVVTNGYVKNNIFDFIKADDVYEWKNGCSNIFSTNQEEIENGSNSKIFSIEKGKKEIIDRLYSNLTIGEFSFSWRGEELGKKSSELHFTPVGLPILSGTNVQRYQYPTASTYIKEKDVKKDILNYKKPKILIRQLGNFINATIDESGHIVLQSVYCLIPKNNINIYYLAGILNSRLFDILYKILSGDKQTFKRILLENIRKLPLIIAPNIIQLKIKDLVCKILYFKSKKDNTDEIENQIDLIVYHLYKLTYDEVLIVDPNPPFSREEYDNFNIEDYGREE